MSKSKIIEQFKVHGTDTGSPEVQVALLTKRIEELSKHFQKHVKDNTSRRGMMKLISRRKGLLEYLKRVDMDRYRNLIGALGLRK
jgi:small subunit ribosomal protein S15